MYSSLWKKRDEREWNVTNNKRNLLPLLHGRAPQGGNVNDIPRDEVDLERKRERESSSKCWKIRLESKKEGLVSFFFGNTISKNCTNTGNTCKTYYYWNAASLIWRTTLFVSKAIRSNELAVDEHSRGERGHLLTKILVTMKPGREIIPYLYDDPKFRAGREPIPGGIYIYRFNKITRSANGELHTTGKTWIGDNPRNPSC